jgi:sporulation protein YlmC with PRC-barrel domain
MEVQEDKLTGKTLMNKEGYTLGIIKELLATNHTGEATSILVKPSNHIDPMTYNINDQGDLLVQIETLVQVKDIVIIE